MAKVCIVCEKEKNGHLVADDIVISALRWIKGKTGSLKNNTLVVCDDCMEAHKAKRQRFESKLVQHVVLGAVILLLLFFLPLLSGAGFSLYSVVLGVVLAGFIIAFSGIYHWPRTVDNSEKAISFSKSAAAGKAKKKK